MPQVRFTQHPKLPRDWSNKPYKKDWVGNMTQDEADRWVRRGVAEIISENKAVIHGANLAAAQSSDEKVKLQQINMQRENDAKAKAEAEAAEAKEEAEVKIKVANATIVGGASGVQPQPLVRR